MRLKHGEDAFGQMLRDHLEGRPAREIVEREDGYIAAGIETVHYFAKFPDWPKHQRMAMRYVRGRVLDVGCGAGRHALYLQARGLRVVGIDVSPLAVQICRRRGLRHAHVLSLRDVGARLGTFDTIVMLGNNFGLFGSLPGARRLLRRLHGMTSPRARIIAESRDPHKTDDPFHREYHRLNSRRGRLAGQLRMRVRHRKYATPWFGYLIVSKSEMARILLGTGWQTRTFLDTGEVTYIAVIEKR